MLATKTKATPPDNTYRIQLPKLHAAQRTIKSEAGRFNVLVAGRRFGKNILFRDLAISTVRNQKPVGWFAPSYRMLTEDFREMRGILSPIITQANESEKTLRILGGGVIDFWSLANPDAPRGRKYKTVIINEAGYVKDLSYIWSAVIRPLLADLRGGGWIGGTPKGLNGFYELYQAAGEGGDWRRFKYPTEANPHISPDEIAQIRAALPGRVVKQEIDADFLSDGAYFQGVEAACTILQPDQPEQHKGHRIVGGLDWAQAEDYTVLTLVCAECCRVVDWDRFNRLDYTYQREKIISMLERWQAAVLPERNSIGAPNIEMLRDRVHVLSGPDNHAGFSTSTSTKPLLIQKLSAAIEHDGLQCPADYADELRSYEVETLAQGYPKFGAPDGKHDDRVISLALAWWAVSSMTWLMS